MPPMMNESEIISETKLAIDQGCFVVTSTPRGHLKHSIAYHCGIRLAEVRVLEADLRLEAIEWVR
jgi:hypothetical protein